MDPSALIALVTVTAQKLMTRVQQAVQSNHSNRMEAQPSGSNRVHPENSNTSVEQHADAAAVAGGPRSRPSSGVRHNQVAAEPLHPVATRAADATAVAVAASAVAMVPPATAAPGTQSRSGSPSPETAERKASRSAASLDGLADDQPLPEVEAGAAALPPASLHKPLPQLFAAQGGELDREDLQAEEDTMSYAAAVPVPRGSGSSNGSGSGSRPSPLLVPRERADLGDQLSPTDLESRDIIALPSEKPWHKSIQARQGPDADGCASAAALDGARKDGAAVDALKAAELQQPVDSFTGFLASIPTAPEVSPERRTHSSFPGFLPVDEASQDAAPRVSSPAPSPMAPELAFDVPVNVQEQEQEQADAPQGGSARKGQQEGGAVAAAGPVAEGQEDSARSTDASKQQERDIKMARKELQVKGCTKFCEPHTCASVRDSHLPVYADSATHNCFAESQLICAGPTGTPVCGAPQHNQGHHHILHRHRDAARHQRRAHWRPAGRRPGARLGRREGHEHWAAGREAGLRNPAGLHSPTGKQAST